MDTLLSLSILSTLFVPALLQIHPGLPDITVSVPPESYFNFSCVGFLRLTTPSEYRHLIPADRIPVLCVCEKIHWSRFEKLAPAIQLKCLQETESACPPDLYGRGVCDFSFLFNASLDKLQLECETDNQATNLAAIRVM